MNVRIHVTTDKQGNIVDLPQGINNDYELSLLLNWIIEDPESYKKGQFISYPLTEVIAGLLPELSEEWQRSNSPLLFSQ